MTFKQQSEHTVLYRKYRPQTFKDIRGQEQVTVALQGAIAKGKIPHALLFAGPRGIGKTSIARIFARDIGTKEMDIYEIDAASNRRIEDIRTLREAVHSLPFESEYKVYIIDEVHMLTPDAFNALLKTLEEPPRHVIFILATTELDKVLSTIVSRCQVFTFKAPSRALLREAILDVSKSEGFKLTPDGADIIAIAADSSFRDALGITQKVITASPDSTADADEVALIVGAPKSALLQAVVQGIHERNAEKALNALREVGDASLDIKLFARLLLERMRAVILMRNAPRDAEVTFANFSPEDAEALRTIAKDGKTSINSRTLLRFLEVFELLGKTHIPQLPLELAVLDIIGEKSEASQSKLV